MTNKAESDLSHKFEMVVGGISVIGGAVLNLLLVRPVKSLFSKATGIKTNNSGNLFSDLIPLNHE